MVQPEQLLGGARGRRHVYIDDKVKDYIVDVVFATREPARYGLKDLGAADRVRRLAARDRASTWRRARTPSSATAATSPRGRQGDRPDVLRHRVVLTYEAEAEEVTTEQVAVERRSRWSRSRDGAAMMIPKESCSRAPQDRDPHRRAGRRAARRPYHSVFKGRAWRSARCASTSPATTSAPSTGTSPRA